MERSGSITVEAAVVVPLALMMIFLLISLDFYVHDKSYYTLCALETALTGSSLARKNQGDAEELAKEKMSSLTKAHRMPTELPRGEVKIGGTETEATFCGTVYRLWGYGTWDYEVSGTVQIIRPQERIRPIRMVKNLADRSSG